MRVERLTFSAPKDLTEAVKELAAEQHLSISAWLVQAAESAARTQRLTSAMDDWEVEHGSLTSEQLAAAARVLDEAASRAT